VVTGQVRIQLLSGGQPKKLNSRFTNVWVKRPQGWQMVAWQSTPLPA
jgi:ketosteroid isomerase-like protein